MGGDGGCHIVSSAFGALHQKEYDVNVYGVFFLALESCLGLSYMFTFTPCSFFIGLQLHITSKFSMYGAF